MWRPIRTDIETMAQRRTYAQRRETFGFETATPWSLDALRLLCNTPRAYLDLLDAWDRRHPGTCAAVERLTDAGFLDHQAAVVVNTVTGQPATITQGTRPVTRYKITTKGSDALARWQADVRYFDLDFPRSKGRNTDVIVAFVAAFDLRGADAKIGMSFKGAVAKSGITQAQWWLKHLLENKYIKARPNKAADVRCVVPEHWRVNSHLRLQLRDTLGNYSGQWGHLVDELQLATRKATLGDVDPGLIKIKGAVHYEHDVTSANMAGLLVASEQFAPGEFFRIEGVHNLSVNNDVYPWQFVDGTANSTGYQPDIELTAVDSDGTQRRVAVEYERSQSRGDGWEHIEKFVGYTHLHAPSGETNDLLFVVDSQRRKDSYVELIEAYTDWATEDPSRLPANRIRLGVATEDGLANADDPLDVSAWDHLDPWSLVDADDAKGAIPGPVLHRTKRKAGKAQGKRRTYSPFHDYF